MPVVNTTSGNLRAYKKGIRRKVENLVIDSITEVELMATGDAPSFVSVDKKFTKGGLTGEVGVFGNNEMAAYIEFGTGLSASQILAPYPSWVKNIAMEFYINGQGTLKGKPYLFNNFLVIQERFIKKLNTIINGRVNDN